MKAAIYLGKEQEFLLDQISKAIQTAADPSRALNVTIRF